MALEIGTFRPMPDGYHGVIRHVGVESPAVFRAVVSQGGVEHYHVSISGQIVGEGSKRTHSNGKWDISAVVRLGRIQVACRLVKDDNESGGHSYRLWTADEV
jgi:uncharacterized protein (DUF736 family)